MGCAAKYSFCFDRHCRGGVLCCQQGCRFASFLDVARCCAKLCFLSARSDLGGEAPSHRHAYAPQNLYVFMDAVYAFINLGSGGIF